MGALFEQLEMGALRGRNRVVRAATYEALATEDGHVTPELLAVYEQLAEGGAGIIIAGYEMCIRDSP